MTVMRFADYRTGAPVAGAGTELRTIPRPQAARPEALMKPGWNRAALWST